jgi:predicted acylesterase/phospholipase RssA
MSSGTDTPKYCDLVMKGGITSGIVYPPALRELAKQYTFRQIGGTSAGAIAAACAAAAQYGNGSGKSGSGFAGLEGLSDWLGEGSNLLELFQPSPEMRPLFKTFLSLSGSSPAKSKPGYVVLVLRTIGRLTGALVRYNFAGFLMGAAIGVAIAIFLRWLTISGTGVWQLVPPSGWPRVWAVFGAILCGWLGGLIAGVIGLFRIATEKIPKNFFGMCRGHADNEDSATVPALTDWLHGRIQTLAGLSAADQPLTFGMLKSKEITLNMVTTNLSQGQPVNLPFDQKVWIFNEDELRRLFPAGVVQHLIAKARKGERVSLEKLPGYHFVPVADDIPIVVAMRMSLSFPVLICAVPLYSVKLSAMPGLRRGDLLVPTNPQTDLDLNWFSDGGISSNFPIHFFDNWLPKCPTFGINLRSMPKDQSRQHAKDRDVAGPEERQPKVNSAMEGQVFLPSANAISVPEFQPIGKIADFLGAIWNTAQNYHDNMQASLPSYRERIVNVRFESDEGGLNLTMDAGKVKDVQAKGAMAGVMLREDFDWRTHKWVRFQVLMPQLEEQLKKTKETLQLPDYAKLLNDPPASAYERTADWRYEATRRVDGLLEMIRNWEQFDGEFLKDHPQYAEECFFPFECPKPRPVLRVTPKL